MSYFGRPTHRRSFEIPGDNEPSELPCECMLCGERGSHLLATKIRPMIGEEGGGLLCPFCGEAWFRPLRVGEAAV